jgi:MoaA/NifB/PqqE/SkfB family radical SAM enzyme
MDTSLAKRLITELWSNGICRKITFHVMGEPTLHPGIFEILAHAQKEGAPVGLTTNGAVFSTEIADRLLDYDIQQVDISLQSPDQGTFALRRARNLTFDQYVDGILRFVALHKAKKSRSMLRFRFHNTRFGKKDGGEGLGAIRVISSTADLRKTFSEWTRRIYGALQVDGPQMDLVMKRIARLVSYKWNVMEIYKNIFFETYYLLDWGDAFADGRVHDAWAGYCFGMRDHFSILYNGDVILCCIDFNGHTKIGNVLRSSLREVLSSDRLGRIMSGFRRFRLVHPYCRKCLGGRNFLGRVGRPLLSIVSMKLLKPFLHKHTLLPR